MTTAILKFPIGHFQKPEIISKEILLKWIVDITTFPERLKTEVKHLTNEQLNTPYRPDGWTIRQVVHHCADSHMNSLTRLKLTLTEDRPTVRPYFEDRWAELIDSKDFPIDSSIKILEGLHQRWAILLNNLTDIELTKTYYHPEQKKEFTVDEYIGLYAWHCNHHLAHITTLKNKKGWE